MKRPSAAPRAARVVLALSAASVLYGCASGSSAPPPSAGGAKKRLVLVEARGPGPEIERFVPRLLSAASDRGLGAIVDARLSGAHLADVAAAGEISAAFRREYPGDVYIGALMSPCTIQRHEGRVYDRQQTPGGVPVRTETVVVTYDAECSVVLTLVGEAGAAVKTIDVTGRNGSAEVSASNTEAEGQAAADAADRAAKKLASFVR
ncbi:MAG TPA: hypothetical protein PLB01_11030 [Thermoanaerobaculia bacterium]|nr:hypothetical protein [Thermoanaerobaculia bacterium]